MAWAWGVIDSCDSCRFNLAEEGEGEDKQRPKCAGLLLIDFTGVKVNSGSRAKG